MARELTENDRWTFNEGTHRRLYEVLGAHPDGDATWFRVWAPNARRVSVIGEWNGWTPHVDELHGDPSGIWQARVPGAALGHLYKFAVTTAAGEVLHKTDPVGFAFEQPPRTAAIVAAPTHEWGDQAWMASRAGRNSLHAPISVYEVHLGSWSRQVPHDYVSLAKALADHVERCGFTHVELLPVMEHPFFGSWGYQTTGYFAPTARYGPPEALMAAVDHLHRRGIGVILDWVPSHFPSDEFALARFDGTHLYEHADPRLGFHPDWNSLIFNYDRHEVRSFLLSGAHYWLDRFHVDGIRVDAVASMLYRDYSRQDGAWIPNEHGGRENLGAITFLQELNRSVYADFPDVQTFAEESTAWPMVSRPTDIGGLGFGSKWDMGWMHDTLRYLARDPIYRSHHHGELVFRSVYAFSENFILPLSHDEVVHGKGSLYAKQWGDDWQKRAGLRLLYGYQYALPGKKLLFMGAELAAHAEWHHEGELPWALLDEPAHAGVRLFLRDLNLLYRREPAMHDLDCDPRGFAWVEPDDGRASVLAFQRRARDGRPVIVVCNFTPTPRHDYRIGVPVRGRWEELLNSDASLYGGSGVGNLGQVVADDVPWHGHEWSVALSLPPLGVVFLAPQKRS
jgi:1,4-alpha-glucan branching enzyme